MEMPCSTRGERCHASSRLQHQLRGSASSGERSAEKHRTGVQRRGRALALLLAAVLALGLAAPALAYRDVSGDAKYAEFFKWLADNGVPYSRVALSETSGKGLGIVARLPIRGDEPVMRIPMRVLMSQMTARESPRIGQVIRAHEKSLSRDCILALHLLDERFTNTSFWQPYIRLLPRHFTTLAYFDEEELEALQGTHAHGLARGMQELVRREHETMVAPLVQQYPRLFPKKRYSLAAYRWALSVVFSRGMDLVWQGERLRALTPLSDFLNHAPGIPTVPGLDEMTQAFVMSTPGRAWRAGEEVSISYGEQGNAALLQLYGFTLEENWADTVRVDVRLDEASVGREKAAVAAERGLPKNASFALAANGSLPGDLLAALRVMHLDPFELDHGLHAALKRGAPVSARNEAEALASLRRTLEGMAARHPSTLEEDRELLRRPLPENVRNAIRVRAGEKLVLQRTLAAIAAREEALAADPAGLRGPAASDDD